MNNDAIQHLVKSEEEYVLPAAQYLRIQAEAKLSVAAAEREKIAAMWPIIRKMEREARDLIKLARMEDDVN
jgi:hypothetical protein